MNKYISSRYINEKSRPIRSLMNIVDSATESDNISEELSDYDKREIAFAFAVIAKELDIQIPDV